MSGLIEKAIERVLLGENTTTVEDSSDFGSVHKIVILQRGFVYAGDVSRAGDYLVIRNAVNVRRWGTNNGLGELAAKGNQSETTADAAGVVRVHQLSVVAMIDCAEVIHATS